MKPPPFRYATPKTLSEALDCLAGDESARILAGGQSLVPLLNFRLARPSLLVDLNRAAGLDGIEVRDGALVIGAMARQRAVERSPVVQGRLPILSRILHFVGHPQTRNRGTIGGSLAHAEPAAELPLAATLLDARLVARGRNAERVLSPREFFVTYLTNSLRPGEILREIIFPIPRAAGWGFEEFSIRHGDFALVSAATLLWRRGERIREARLVVGGVGPVPVRATAAEAALAGAAPTPAAFEEAGRLAAQGVEPDSDVHATAEYRRNLTRVLARRALESAWETAKDE